MRAALALVLLVVGPASALADDPAPAAEEKNPFKDINFQEGPVKGDLGGLATVDVPAGMAFIGAGDARKFIEATQNLPTGKEKGIIVSGGEGGSFWIDFEFDPIGYVKDDEKDKIDAAAILKSLTEGTEEANAERRKRGWEELHVDGWHTMPKYDPTTHNLEWATNLKSASGADINYNVRVLGRRGVMEVTLIAGKEELEPALVKLRGLLAGFAYVPEQNYASYKPGDKVAEYGLTALVVGGTLAVAAKTGLLAKFWKVLVAGVVALGAGIRKLFGGGRKKQEPVA